MARRPAKGRKSRAVKKRQANKTPPAEPIDTGTPERAQHGEGIIFEEFDPKRLGLRAECTPGRRGRRLGAVHARALTHLERLERNGTITSDHLDVANLFYHRFTAAGMEGYASINMFKSGGFGSKGRAQPPTIADRVLDHRKAVRNMIFGVLSPLQGSVVWDVCGREMTIAQWHRDRAFAGLNINRGTAAGLLLGALDLMCANRDVLRV